MSPGTTDSEIPFTSIFLEQVRRFPLSLGWAWRGQVRPKANSLPCDV